MKAKLISREHGEFAIGRTATIGRSADCAVQLEASVVSSRHARIEFDPKREAYVLEDLGSLNGTYLDGVRLDRKEVLGKLHVVRFGDDRRFVFQLLDSDPSAEPGAESGSETVGLPPTGKTRIGGEVPVIPASLRDGDQGQEGEEAGRTRVEQDAVPLPEVLAEASEAVRARSLPGPAFALEVELGDHTQRFPLKAGENVVGRSNSAEIRLELPDLSRRHATLIVSSDSVRIRDEGSRNRTFVDGEAIESEIALPVGARVVFGRLEARLLAAEGPAEGASEPDAGGREGEDPRP